MEAGVTWASYDAQGGSGFGDLLLYLLGSEFPNINPKP